MPFFRTYVRVTVPAHPNVTVAARTGGDAIVAAISAVTMDNVRRPGFTASP